MREEPELVWEVYQSLEEEFLNYLKFVPLTESHYTVWSHPLTNLFNNIGSSIDSFFKNAIFCNSIDDFEGIDEIRINEKKHNMKVYREIFNSRYYLSDKQLFELKNLSNLCPFNNWKGNTTPQWWSAYRKIKHNRFQHKEQATIKNTLDALGGLFLLFLTHKETIPVLVDREIINSHGLAKKILKSLLLEGEPIKDRGGVNRIYAKTALFGYVYDIEGWALPDYEKQRILSPGYQGY